MTVSVLWLFFMLQWVDLQCVIAVFPDHTNLLTISMFCCFRQEVVFKFLFRKSVLAHVTKISDKINYLNKY